jgi:hypothetical protein
MNIKDLEHLNWIYNRLVNVHNENPAVDYMRRLFKISNPEPKPLGMAVSLIINDYLLHSYHTATIPTEGTYTFFNGLQYKINKVETDYQNNTVKVHVSL